MAKCDGPVALLTVFEYSDFSEASPAVMPCPSSGSNCHSKIALYAVGLVAGGAAIGYLVASRLSSRRCNTKVNLGCEKCVDTCDVEDIGEKKVFCRCWKSDKFPYCDGSHTKHNKDTGDNVGPLIVKNEKK